MSILRHWCWAIPIAIGLAGSPVSAQTLEIQTAIEMELNRLRTAAPLVIPPAALTSVTEEVAIQALTAKIDRHLERFWAANQIKPSAPADDAEFLRRISLDLIGRIPSIYEVRKFLADPDPRKRSKKIAELLKKPAFASHYTSVLRKDWLPQTLDNPQLQFVGVQFENWLKEQTKKNVGYDKIVREILTAPTLFGIVRMNQPTPDANKTAFGFNQANEFKPENVAASASRLFMGVKLECAQCHNHPFEEISREQFWQTAAFFVDLQPAIANSRDPKIKREINIQDVDPKKQKRVEAIFFNGQRPTWKDDVSPRTTFVDWLTAANNPYFAKNAVQRTWAHFFGLGFIDPIDEPSEKNPELIPELVQDLASAFQNSGFDTRFLIQAIARSKAYQLSSKQTDVSQQNPRHFARMPLKAMSAEQLFDSIALATGTSDGSSGDPQRRAFNGGARREFTTRFASTERSIERQTSILQALTLMNGKFVDDQTSLERSSFLASIIDAPFMTPESRAEAMFLATLSRLPTPEEMQKFTSYIKRGGSENNEKKAVTDLFWALLNSSEFILNH